jgi:hypothetical protein
MSFKKYFTLFSVFVLSISILSAVSAQASSEFLTGDTITANKGYDNVYATGGTVTQDGEVKKDLVVAGGTVTTAGLVARNLIVAGGTVTVKSSVGAGMFVTGGTVTIDTPNTFGSVRVAGGTVTISGNFTEDVFVAGGDVIIKNATIAGDIYVGAGTLTIQNSSIKGKIAGEYGELKGDDLKTQVSGARDIKKSAISEQKTKSFFDYFNVNWELSVIVVCLLVGWFLTKRNRLSIPSIKWSGRFGLDVLVGFGVLVLPTIVALVLAILQLFPIALLVLGFYPLFVISSFLFLPIYLGNFIKHSFNLGFNIKWIILISYGVLFGAGVLSSLNFLGLLGLIVFIFGLANLGFLLRKTTSSVNHYLSERN